MHDLSTKIDTVSQYQAFCQGWLHLGLAIPVSSPHKGFMNMRKQLVNTSKAS